MRAKIVFLDIDGVLNNPGCYRIASGAHAPADPRCIAALNLITDTTGALVVVSSTWRLGGLMFCREKLTEWGAHASVVDITPRLIEQNPGGRLVVAQTRGAEIGKWLLDQERFEIESFVILDDDSDMDGHSNRLVQTNGAVGLTLQDAARAIQMLTT